MRALLLALALLLSAPAAWAQGGLQQPLPGDARIKAGNVRVCSLFTANFNSTADQVMTCDPRITAYTISRILVTNCSVSMTTAAGGIYPSAAKAGTAIVAAVQTYVAATSSAVVVTLTLVAGSNALRYTTNVPLYLSLTTGQGSAAACDVFVVGDDFSPNN